LKKNLKKQLIGIYGDNKMDKEKKIPKAKIEEGIKFSLQKAEEHLAAAEILIKNNFLDNAVDAIEFAIEEFGRAVYLKKRFHKNLETIETALEKNHWLKYNEAFSVLPKSLKTVWEGTINPLFPANYFPKGYFPIVKETISPYTRLNAIFTYYDEKTQSWRSGIRTDKEKLMSIVEEIKRHIEKFSL